MRRMRQTSRNNLRQNHLDKTLHVSKLLCQFKQRRVYCVENICVEDRHNPSQTYCKSKYLIYLLNLVIN
jgi:hypothetical protein